MPNFDTSVLLEPPSMVMLQEMWKRKQVEETNLSVRTINCLFNSNISNLFEVANKSESELLKIKNFGRKSLVEIRQLLSYFFEFTDDIHTHNVHTETFIERMQKKQQRRTTMKSPQTFRVIFRIRRVVDWNGVNPVRKPDNQCFILAEGLSEEEAIQNIAERNHETLCFSYEPETEVDFLKSYFLPPKNESEK